MQTAIEPLTMRLGKREVDIFPYWMALLGAGIVFGLVGAYNVFAYGLQVTGLSNQVPWGLWITLDLSSIALGGSAFVFGVIVYLLRIKHLEIIGKLAVILGFLGYSTAGMVLLFDLGQPLRFWHPIVFWQPHSLLWEITMCVVLYLTVLMAELLPVVMEHPVFSEHPLVKRFPILKKISDFMVWLAHRLHSLGPVLAVIGLTLSLLHQASLGATYAVLSGRGMWFNQSAPVQFVLSAMGGGTALLFFLSVVVFRIMRPGLVKDEALYDVARIAGAIVLLCIYIRVWDWAVTNYYSFDTEVSLQTQMLNTITPYSTSFWVGQVLFALIPGSILLMAKRIRNFRILMIAAILPAFCTVLVRWNYNFSGLIASITYDPFTPTVVLNTYAPTWQEWAIASLVISYWLIGFSLAARFLPFQKLSRHSDSAKKEK
ncbi:MAG: polysulfide reductase NrfD [Anaerolineales bacterium]|nr:polysulfide reductase NrfD [Anaerolineales bacterium]MCB9111694.1 polysulfide reductase NrfD [Anaerolineales bacterium]